MYNTNMQYKDFIIESLSKAGKIARDNFGKVVATSKKDDNNQVLTETDLEIGKFLIKQIKKEYPQFNIIDEETGVIDNHSLFTWVIDPIDGTSNYANGIPLYGTMIGLLKGGEPIAGGISLPAFGEICYAEEKSGAYCNGEKIQVSEESKLLSSLIAYAIDGHQEDPEFTRKEVRIMAEIILSSRNLRNTGSCYDAILLAKGKIGGYLNRTSKIWDNVAEQILIEEAGGTYTDFFGNPMDYSRSLTKADINFTFCAAAPDLHEALQKIIQMNK